LQFHDSTVHPHIKLESAAVHPTNRDVGYATFSMTVPKSLCNAGSNLHGGAVALIFDILTSVTVGTVAREGFWDTGHVSRTLNCSYVRPAPVGTELLIETEVVSLGKSLAMLRGTMRRKEDGKVCYICEHHKVKVDFRQMGDQKERSEEEVLKEEAEDIKAKL
jgi:acyl-coenzyme A thioesterase 13